MVSVQGTLMNFLEQKNPADVEEMKMKYFMVCTRGLLSGYAQGLYNNKNENVSKDCMSETTYRNFMELGRYSSSGNYVELFKASAKVFQIGFELNKYCRMNELSFEVFAFCLNETSNCTQESIMNNLMGDIFEVTDTLNKVAEVMYTEYFNPNAKIDYSKVAESEARYQELGLSLGKITRTSTKFNKN